jgi:hypothetical protein
LKQPRESRREIDKRKATQTISFHGDARSNILGKKKQTNKQKQKNRNKKDTVCYKYSYSLVNPGGLSSKYYDPI